MAAFASSSSFGANASTKAANFGSTATPVSKLDVGLARYDRKKMSAMTRIGTATPRKKINALLLRIMPAMCDWRRFSEIIQLA
jgi:hypothetical protein